MAAWTQGHQLAPQPPGGWYAGAGLSAVSQEAILSFDDRAEDAAWRQLLIADGLLATGHLTDAFAIYRSVEAQLPSMVTIHDRLRTSTSDPPTRNGPQVSGSMESFPRTPVRSAKRSASFARGDTEEPSKRPWPEPMPSRATGARVLHASWRARVRAPRYAPRLAGTARLPRHDRARRGSHQDAVTELTAALELAPGNPTLTFELATACYAARNYEQALATVVRCCAHVRTILVS